MTILLNGEARQLEGARDVPELLTELGVSSHALLVEHNGLALRLEEWPYRLLTEGDRVEIIQIVAGG